MVDLYDLPGGSEDVKHRQTYIALVSDREPTTTSMTTLPGSSVQRRVVDEPRHGTNIKFYVGSTVTQRCMRRMREHLSIISSLIDGKNVIVNAF